MSSATATGGSPRGRFYTEAEREAWGRSLGLRGGVVRRAAKADRDEKIIEGRAADSATASWPVCSS